jgi:hypothetical protein
LPIPSQAIVLKNQKISSNISDAVFEECFEEESAGFEQN